MIFSHCPHEAGRRLIDRPGTPAPLTTTASTRQRTRKRPAAAEHTHDAPGPEVASMHCPAPDGPAKSLTPAFAAIAPVGGGAAHQPLPVEVDGVGQLERKARASR